tara:strand:- start:965 stop:1192 length:228 start_codon:yes stop_codon:yes gene_type:complete
LFDGAGLDDTVHPKGLGGDDGGDDVDAYGDGGSGDPELPELPGLLHHKDGEGIGGGEGGGGDGFGGGVHCGDSNN